MKAVVLAGGKGSRLRPFTYTGAKQLIPIANKPVLFYALDQLAGLGVRDVAVVVGETRDQVIAAVGDGGRFGLRVVYVEQDAPRGIAHGVGLCREFIAADDFVVLLGDNFARDGIHGLVEQFRSCEADCGVVLKRVPNPQAFGVAELADGRLVRVVEKPVNPPTDLAVTGIYYFRTVAFDVIEALQPSARGELEITDAIQCLIDRGHRVDYAVLEGPWIDTGKMADILEANRLVLERIERRIEGEVDGESHLIGAVVVEAGARVVRSTLKGPAIIGSRSVIEDAYVGAFSAIDHDSVLRGVEITDSIVLDGCCLSNVPGRIEDSLIGRDVSVSGVGERPRVYRLTLGDHSRLDIPSTAAT
jgi:glucose-1-phosphate thymidylyltransferase